MKLLCIQPRRIGDVLMTTPLLAALKSQLPACTIHFLVQKNCSMVLRGNPDVEKIIPYDDTGFLSLTFGLRREAYDAVIDFMGLPKTALLGFMSGAQMRIGYNKRFRAHFYTHAIGSQPQALYSPYHKAQLLSPLNVTLQNAQVRLFPGEAEEKEASAAASMLGLDKISRLAAISPVSRRDYKRWPLAKYALVCDTLYQKYGFCFLPLFGPGESVMIEELAVLLKDRESLLFPCPPISFNALYPLLKRCAFYFGNDNGTRHVAIAAGLPTATVFGVPNPVEWTPPVPARHRWVWGKDQIDGVETSEFMDQIEKLLHENHIV